MSDEIENQHRVSDEQTFAVLEVGAAFAALTDQEKRYAHFLSLASWHGSLICLEQCSAESAPLFGVLLRLFSYQSCDALRVAALAAGVDAVDFERFLRFSATFLGNMGNYLSFGDTKLIPALPAVAFRACVAATSAQGALRTDLLARCDAVLGAVYSVEPRVRELGYPDVATSTYYSPSVTRAQIDTVNKFMTERGMRLLLSITYLKLCAHFELCIPLGRHLCLQHAPAGQRGTLRCARAAHRVRAPVRRPERRV